MKKIMFLALLVTVLSFLPSLLYSQVDTAWVRRYNGSSNGEDVANAIVVDASGNVYVTGKTYNSTSDTDYITIKYNSSGVQQWVATYNDPTNSSDVATALIIDGQGNVYVTGRSWGGLADYDYVTIKYNSVGTQQWLQRYNGLANSTDVANAIGMDFINYSVYVTGKSKDSGTAYYNYVTIKYNSNGTQQWVAEYSGPGTWTIDEATAIAVDYMRGIIYVTGGSMDATGGGTTYQDYVTIRYSWVGVDRWTARYNGPDNNGDCARSIAVFDPNNIYVTGESFNGSYITDFATVKYDSWGTQKWAVRYNGPGSLYDWASAVAVDGSNNCYVTGTSYGTSSSADYATVKYNSSGTQQWVARYNGPANGWDGANAIWIDIGNNIYVTGGSYGSGTSSDYATIKYNSSGTEQWVARYRGPADSIDVANDISVDANGNVYVTGMSFGSGTNYDIVTIKYVQTGAVEENHSPFSAYRLSLEIYPNPARSYFEVRSPFNAQGSVLRMFDVSGKEVKSEELKGKNNRVSLEGIKNGVYFVQVGNETTTKKLVITK